MFQNGKGFGKGSAADETKMVGEVGGYRGLRDLAMKLPCVDDLEEDKRREGSQPRKTEKEEKAGGGRCPITFSWEKGVRP